jgi:hypothetical protein
MVIKGERRWLKWQMIEWEYRRLLVSDIPCIHPMADVFWVIYRWVPVKFVDE